MPNDTPTIYEKWIYATLAANATLAGLVGNNSEMGTPNIYFQRAPERGAQYPMVIYASRLNGGADLEVIGSIRVWTDDQFVVRAIGRQDALVNGVMVDELPLVRQIAYQIDASLHRGSGATADGKVLWSRRLGPLVLPPETVNGVQYVSRGGIYQMLAQ